MDSGRLRIGNSVDVPLTVKRPMLPLTMPPVSPRREPEIPVRAARDIARIGAGADRILCETALARPVSAVGRWSARGRAHRRASSPADAGNPRRAGRSASPRTSRTVCARARSGPRGTSAGLSRLRPAMLPDPAAHASARYSGRFRVRPCPSPHPHQTSVVARASTGSSIGVESGPEGHAKETRATVHAMRTPACSWGPLSAATLARLLGLPQEECRSSTSWSN